MLKTSKFVAAIGAFFFISAICLAGGHPQYSNEKIHLESGTLTTRLDFSPGKITAVSSREVYDGRYYRLLQFDRPATQQEKEQLTAAGIRLLSYVPFNTWFVSIPEAFDFTTIAGLPIRTIVTVPSAAKMSTSLNNRDFPNYAVPGPGLLDVTVQLYKDVNFAAIENELKTSGFELLFVRPVLKTFSLRIDRAKLSNVVALPFIKYVEPITPAGEPEDVRGRSLHRSNAINTDMAFGRNYNGDTVTISLADDGAVGPHIDFKGRMYDINNTGPGGNHGDMTSGIAVGAGNLDPTKRGMADGATLLVHDIGNYEHIYDSPIFFNLFGAVITSTSYSQGCNDYNTNSVNADQLAYDNPQLTYVFSAGNRGQNACSNPAGEPWGTIT
ncbi:MAG: hypothetical protein RIQ47_915, partial [Bacteroidota bacterium]